MLGIKPLIIGGSALTLGGGVIYLSWKAEQEELREEFKMDEFKTEWDKGNDKQKLDLLEKELKKLCYLNLNGCKNEKDVKDIVNQNKDWKSFFEEISSFSSSLKTSFDETCSETIKEMKIKAFCPK